METRASRILIIEDEPIVRKVVELALNRANFSTASASNGLAGLNLYLELKPEIGLALVDLSMPVMDGVELVRSLLAIDPDLKIILMTGFSPTYAVPEDLQKRCSLLRKPFTAETLVSCVDDYLNGSAPHRSAAGA